MAMTSGEVQYVSKQEFNPNNGRWKFKQSIKVDETYYSVFDKDLSSFKKGDVVQIDYTQNGKYQNINNITLLQSANQTLAQRGNSPNTGSLSKEEYWDNRQKFEQEVQFPSFVRRDALNAAIEWIKIEMQAASEHGEKPKIYTVEDLDKLTEEFKNKIVGVPQEVTETPSEDAEPAIEEELVE